MRRLLLIVSGLLFVLALGAILLSPYFRIKSERVEFIVFEDFACSACYEFYTKELPVILDHYQRDIKEGRVVYSFYPIANGPESKEATLAYYAVALVKPESAHAFASFIFAWPPEKLGQTKSAAFITAFAQKESDFPLKEALKMLNSKEHANIEKENKAWVYSIYHDEIHMPTILVQGRRVPTNTSQAVDDAIEQAIHRIR